ncbi:MAG: type II secretion system F family protein [Thermotogaceae bacterium]|nr:type II secretion system F family protein [Thermotogaceae bacterium]
MPLYKYIACNKNGKKIRGFIEASNEWSATNELVEKGLKVLKIEEKADSIKDKKIKTSLNLKKKRIFFSISTGELAIFSRQLSTMISAGIRVKNALEILSEQTVFTKRFRNILKFVIDELEEGVSLSEAFEKTGAFEPIFINLIKAGEEGGVLDETLQKVADFYESSKELTDEVKAAMRYPAFVLGFAILIVGVIAFYIIPSLIKNIALKPAGITAFLLSTSEYLSVHKIEIAIAFFPIVVAIRLFLSSNPGRKFKYILSSITPGLKNIKHKASIERFSRTLGTLVGAGVSLPDALMMAAQASGSYSIISKIEKVIVSVKEGKTLRDSLKEVNIVPHLVYEMIGTGEATGRLDEVLGRVADFYTQQLRIEVKKFVSTIEPVLIAFIGGFIAFLAIGLYSTIFQLQAEIGGGGM